jgi:hypothetical protein
MTHEFKAEDTLKEARTFLEQNSSYRRFSLSTVYPRRDFTDADIGTSLRDLELVPSTVLLVTPSSSSTVGSVVGRDWFSEILSLIMLPFLTLYNFVYSLFVTPPTAAAPTAPAPPPTGGQASGTGARPKDRPSGTDSGTPGTSRGRDGNVARLRNKKEDEDDDNSTWNGNSTQQM